MNQGKAKLFVRETRIRNGMGPGKDYVKYIARLKWTDKNGDGFEGILGDAETQEGAVEICKAFTGQLDNITLEKASDT